MPTRRTKAEAGRTVDPHAGREHARVVGLRRYPVKSMGGESLETVELDARGLPGDRWFAVADGDGHFASGKDTRRFRRRDPVFEYQALTAGDAVRVERDGQSWTVGDAALDADLSARMGLPVRVTPESDVPHQDAGSISIVGTATLEWCADRWGISADPRRLRVNVVVATDEPFAEESWVGSSVRIGGATLRVVDRVERCRMVDIAQDGADPRGRWLKPLAREREMKLAVYADVGVPGVVRIGDSVLTEPLSE